MSKNQFDTHLRYGQGILIKGYKSESSGIMTTKGFADTRARFQTYDDILYFKNYRNAIFQILPASSFDINDQLRFLLENSIENTGNNVQILKAKAKSEHDQFDLNIKSKQKSLVCFGDQIVLRHIDSGTYLSGTLRPAQGKNGAFSVQVTKDLKASLIFKLLPYRSFQNQSNPIPLQSPILIENVFNKGYLTFQRFGLLEKKQKTLFWQKQPIKSDQSYKIPIKTDSTNSQIYECVTHFSDLSIQQVQQQMPWKFQLHFSDVDNQNLVQHDIVYFQHTLNNGVLSAVGDQQIVLKQLKGQKTTELCFYDCLWQIQQYKQRSQNSYILRHLMSGMTLGVHYQKNIMNNQSVPIKPKLIDISDGKGNDNANNQDKLGVIQLKLAKKQGGEIASKSYINICCKDRCLDIVKDRQRQSTKRDVENKIFYQTTQIVKSQAKKQLIDTNKMAAMATNQFDFEIKKLLFTQQLSKHCFVIQEIDDELKSEVLFALSFHSRLIALREDLKWGVDQSEKKVNYIRMMQITQKTKQIKYFLKNTTNEDPNRQFKRPIPKRQIICFHLGISELLFQLLYFMRKNRDGELGTKDGKKQIGRQIFKTKPNQSQKFVEMYNTMYEVIFQLIRDNAQFKIHVSKWISFIFEDVIRYNQQYILKTLLQLLKNNSFFVNNFVTQDLVAYLVDKMLNYSKSHEFHEKKYIQIFRAFCICDNQVNSDNQVLILNKFIKKLAEDDQGAKYQIKLSKRKNQQQKVQQIVCSAAFDKNQAKWRKFSDYYKLCRDQYPTAWSYMVSYLHLIADMCRGRNKIVQSYIDTTMTLDVLTELMTKQKLYDAEAPIIRIMHYLYAQSQNFYPIDTITRIINYNQLNNQIQINSTKASVSPKAFLGPVMVSLVEKLKSYGPIQVKNVAGNQCLYVILDFLKETFILGFWNKREQVQEIYNALERLIYPQPQINYQQIRQQSQKPEIVLMFNCKQKCMEILQFIICLDIDYYLKHLCRTFKYFEIPQKKINLEVTDFLQVNEDSRYSVDFFDQYKKQNPNLAPIVSTKICPKIIQLSKHNNPRLTGSSLRILQKILDFYRRLSNGFIDMIFVCEQNRINLYNFIAQRRDKFFTLQYQTTTKINYINQKFMYFMMYRDEKDAGVMQDLFMISQLVKNENSLANIKDVKNLDASGTQRQLATQKLINFTSERRSSNKMKQQVVDASQIHQKVLRYIFNCKQIPTQQLAIKLLHLCYRFLVSIIQNNQQLKLTLIPHIPKMIHHISRNIGCIDFFKEMYDNNRNMLYNQMDILKLIKVVCTAIQQQYGATSYYKSKLLDFFRYLIYCNGRALSYNQINILKIMQDDSYSNIIINLQPKDIKQQVKKYAEMNSGEIKQGMIRYIKMKPQLTYMVTFFQIMVSLIDDKCKVNSGKLIKKFPFDMLVQCIQNCGRCWPLKRNIRAFLNRLYYFEPQIQTYISTIRTKQIENIIRDLNYFIQIKCKTTSSDFEAQYFENPVRFSYLQSYLYLNLQENLFTLYQIVKNSQLISQFKNYLHSAKNTSRTGPYNFIKICERLGWIRNYFAGNKNIYTTSFIKFLLHELRMIIQEFDDSIYSEGMMFGGDRVPTKQQKDKSRISLIQKIMLGQISTFFVQGAQEIWKQKPLVYQTPPKFTIPKDKKERNQEKLARKLRQIFRRTKRQFQNKDQQISYKQTRLISAFKLSKQINEEYTNIYNERLKQIIDFNIQFKLKKMLEDMQLQNKKIREAQKLKQLEKLRDKNQEEGGENKDNQNPQKQIVQKPQPPLELPKDLINQINENKLDTILQYISSIIQINSVSPDVFSPQIKIFFLKMVIGVIEQSNKTQMETKKLIDEWEGDDWFEYSKQIQSIQVQLKNGRLGTLIAQILKQNIVDNISLANSTLLCGIAYLMGGNVITQKNLIQQIDKDADNRVFRNIMNLINKLGKIILKNIDQSNMKPVQNEQFQVQIIDNYDFYDEKQKYCLRKNVFQPSSTNQVIYHRQCIVTYRRAFKFLQLLCQNNNVDNKNYIRQQKDKMQPVNFITVTTNQLRNLFEVMCKQIVDVPLFLLDFLLQVTQIPIKQNQQALINSSFFEDLCQMSNQFAKPGKIAERNFDQKDNPLEEIYNKSVQIILSNFEGNNKITYETLDAKLEPKFLVNILENKFNSLQINSKQDLLRYIKKQLQTVDQNGNKTVSPMFTDQIMRIFDILIIFMKLKEKIESSRLYGSYLKFKQQNNGSRAEMLDYLENSLIHIQIKDPNDKNQTIYFAKHPVFYSLSEGIRDYVMSVVKRKTQRQKIVSLIGYTSAIKDSIQYSYKLQKSQQIVEQNMTKSYKASATLSIVLCVFMFMYYGVIIEYGDVEFTSNRIYRSIRFVISLMQLSMSICYAYYWFVLKIWYSPEYRPKEKPAQRPQDDALKQVLQKKENKQKFYTTMDFFRLVLFVGSSFIGTFFDPTFFYIHIIDILCQSPQLANIFKAIANTFLPISLVSIMGVIFVVIFCTVTFSNYTKNVYQQKQLKHPQKLCDSMLTCLLALYVSGSIGQTMQTFEIQRFIYDMIYSIFFGLLFGNIISGIMLDAFGNLRETNDQLRDDKQNKCYICGISRQDIQKQKLKFKDHIVNKHFLWNYVFYIISLNAKNKTDYTGLEYNIINQYNLPDEDMKTQWIPDGEAREYDLKPEVQNMLKAVDECNENISKKIEELDENVKEFNEHAGELVAQ